MASRNTSPKFNNTIHFVLDMIKSMKWAVDDTGYFSVLDEFSGNDSDDNDKHTSPQIYEIRVWDAAQVTV